MKFKTATSRITIAAFLFSFLACTSGEKTTLRILTAGIAHESNTFIPHLTALDGFYIRSGNDALNNQAWANYLAEEGLK